MSGTELDGLTSVFQIPHWLPASDLQAFNVYEISSVTSKYTSQLAEEGDKIVLSLSV